MKRYLTARYLLSRRIASYRLCSVLFTGFFWLDIDKPSLQSVSSNGYLVPSDEERFAFSGGQYWISFADDTDVDFNTLVRNSWVFNPADMVSDLFMSMFRYYEMYGGDLKRVRSLAVCIRFFDSFLPSLRFGFDSSKELLFFMSFSFYCGVGDKKFTYRTRKLQEFFSCRG